MGMPQNTASASARQVWTEYMKTMLWLHTHTLRHTLTHQLICQILWSTISSTPFSHEDEATWSLARPTSWSRQEGEVRKSGRRGSWESTGQQVWHSSSLYGALACELSFQRYCTNCDKHWHLVEFMCSLNLATYKNNVSGGQSWCCCFFKSHFIW